jgi:hypothetical protein
MTELLSIMTSVISFVAVVFWNTNLQDSVSMFSEVIEIFNADFLECDDIILEGYLKRGTKFVGMKNLRKFHEELGMMILVKALKILSEYFYFAEIFASLPITRIASARSFCGE